jgi:hypothetical protein
VQRPNSTGGQQPIPYEHLVGNASIASTTPQTSFLVPANTSLIMINGTMGPTQYNAKVKLSPPAPDAYNNVNNTGVKWYETYHQWVACDAVIYVAALDPATDYNVTIVGNSSTEYDLSEIGLHSVTFWNATYNTTNTANQSNPDSTGNNESNPQESSKSVTSPGTIAGAVVSTNIPTG